MRVAISGTHQVGKSTLVGDLLTRLPGAAGVGNILRRLHSEGYGIRSDIDPRTLAVYLARQTADEDAQAQARHLFSDRVFADTAAYVHATVRAGRNLHPWGEGDLALLRSVARLHASRFDLHIYIPVELPMAPETMTVEGSPEFRDLMDDQVRALLGEAWPIPVLTLSGSRRDRVDQVLEALC